MARSIGARRPYLALLVSALGVTDSGTAEAGAQGVVMNELMTSNKLTLTDEDGSFPDWFELFNGSSSVVRLGGWRITDHPSDTARWVFPPLELPPQEHLVIFASSKDRRLSARYPETVIRAGDSCRFITPISDSGMSWTWPDIDDSGWQRGRLGVGYGDGDDSTIISRTVSVYLRMDFEAASVADVQYALLHMDYDDGFVAYVNGGEIARANVNGYPPPFDSTALDNHEAKMYQGLPLELFAVHNIQALIRNGRNVLAIQVHNADPFSSDLSAIPFLTLGLTSPPPNPRGVPDFLQGTFLPIHTDFKLKSDQDTLLLEDSLGQRIDLVPVMDAPQDVSYGRGGDGGADWFFFAHPSPGGANPNVGSLIITPRPSITPDAGFYLASVLIEMANDSSGARIYYTVDGSPPSDTAIRYTGSFRLDTTTVVRAMSVLPGELPSSDRVSTFVIGPAKALPVISLSTAPKNLWDEEIGIYVLGPTYDTIPPNRGANFWQDLERPVHIEFFETDGTEGFELDAGMKIHGGWTRFFPQKSFGIHTRAAYGVGSFNYRLFPDLDINRWEGFILRNSGSDWDHTMFRDGFMTGLMEEEDADIQAYRPAVVYLNGAYWGIYNIRESLNEHYVAQHYDTDPDSVDVMEIWGQVMAGNRDAYDEMQALLENSSLADPANYRRAAEIIDIPNFITYSATNIFVNNGDWPGNNNRFFRIQRDGAKWRWFLFDLDFGFGLHDTSGYRYNSLGDATDPIGQDWPNPPYATLHLRKLLESPRFRNEFITGFADLMNFRLQTSIVLRQMDEKKRHIEPEIGRHLARWGRNMEEWRDKVGEMLPFAQNRPAYMRQFIEQQFNLPGHAELTLEADPPAGGDVRINNRMIPTSPWSGIYFIGVPFTIEATPQPGYRFAGWTGGIASEDRRVTIALGDDRTITALFSRAPGAVGLPIINEINYHSADSFDTDDWIEIYAQDGEVVLDGWTLADDDSAHRFTFPAGTTIPDGGYLVAASDTTLLRSMMPGLVGVIGNLGFGFGAGGDVVQLWSPRGELLDSVAYDDAAPWPIEADGGGSSLELLDPALPNDRPESWRASLGHGSPQETNRYNPPGGFRLLEPADGSRVGNDTVQVVWSSSLDPDTGDTVTYLVEWSLLPDFAFTLRAATTDTFLTIWDSPAATEDSLVRAEGLPDRAKIYWRVTASDLRGAARISDQGAEGWSFDVLLVTLPTTFQVHPVFPNPFNSWAKLRIDVPRDGELEVGFYDIIGRQIFLDRQTRNAGSYAFFLPPEGNRALPSGIYWVVVKYQDKSEIRKMVLVR